MCAAEKTAHVSGADDQGGDGREPLEQATNAPRGGEGEKENRNRRNSHGQKQAERLYAGRACRGHCDHGHPRGRGLGGVLGLCEKGERGGGLTASRRGEHGVCIRVLRRGTV